MSYNTKNKNEAYYYNSKLKYEQMSKQQQLIEQKKIEIQNRLEEKKKKDVEDALKKLNDGKLKNETKTKRHFSYTSFGKKLLPGRENETESEPQLHTNIFSNDGSFLQQFQKISGIKVEVKKKSSSRSKNITPEVIKAELTSEADIKQSEITQSDLVREWKKIEEGIQAHQVEIKPKSLPEKLQDPFQHQLPVVHHGPPHPSQMMTNHILQPHLHQQVFTPQRMAMPPMNYHFNPMHCTMMIPPPMAPSSIPPPAPLNPGSIPSPSPLQPCTIPSPSPLQPYAIPPPSPLLPHSIPPPSPMIPHSIPPPSPLTPHSIPPPLPMRPQGIPPPVQRPPIFLTMVPPPPPPPLEEEKPKVESLKIASPPPCEQNINTEMSINDNVKGLFKNDDYSSSSSDEEEKEQVYGPPNRKPDSSDSDSNRDNNYPDLSNSDKESDVESDRKIDSTSEFDSEVGQESQPIANRDSENSPAFGPILIEDTQTQFPSSSSNSDDAAPPDLCDSEGHSQHSSHLTDSPAKSHNSNQSHDVVKQEPEDNSAEGFATQNSAPNVNTNVEIEVKQEIKPEMKEEKVKYLNFVQGKTENMGDTAAEVVNNEEPPVKKKRKSRWATDDEVIPLATQAQMPPVPIGPVGIVVPKGLGGVNVVVPPIASSVPTVNVPGMSGAMISKVGRSDPALIAYAMKSYGHTNLSEVEWKKVEDHFKINLLYQDMMRKREELQRLEAAGKKKYEYDSDEDTEGGTWEHKLRSAEMEATQLWADELTEQAKGKHHIGDFLPPDELSRFMEKYEALKDGREPDLSDYKEFKLKEDNIGFQMLQKLGWTEGQGLGPDGSGIMDPVNKATMRPENQGLGVERPEDVEADDDEYDAYRKRMMLAYRFRPNPMNNPRRPYY